MEPQPTQRPQWEIDRQLTALIGAHIRVAARAFAPVRHTGQQPLRLAPVRELILPDGSQAAVLAVYFEGRLRHFEREVGVVSVWLDAATSLETATDGPTLFRGQTAVILRGPAIVELAFPFQVERLPADPNNYWRDMRLPWVQLLFLQLKSGDSHLRERKSDGAEIFTIKEERHAGYWLTQGFPVLLVIRNAEGEGRWMEVRDWLKRETDNGRKAVKQIVFAGERFDVMSVRRWRERVLSRI